MPVMPELRHPCAEVQEAGVERIAALYVAGELKWELAFPTLREAVLRVPQDAALCTAGAGLLGRLATPETAHGLVEQPPFRQHRRPVHCELTHL